MDPAIAAENRAERTRLASLVGRLSDADLERPLGGGWTVAVALAHLAFWDRRGLLLLEQWERGQAPLPGEPDSYGVEVLNGALLAEWRALAPRVAARLAVEAAEATDRKVETLGAGVVDAIIAGGESWRLRRSLHRREHLDQIDRALAGG